MKKTFKINFDHDLLSRQTIVGFVFCFAGIFGILFVLIVAVRAQVSVGSGSNQSIIAGKGMGKVVIGASQNQIEAALGVPEKFYEGNMILPDSSAFYFSQGIIVIYDGETSSVKSLSFIGNPAYLNPGDYAGTFQTVKARPDRSISWSATEAQITAAYGAPRHRLPEKRNGAEVVTLTYDQIAFTLNTNKLYYIVVTADNSRSIALMQKRAEEKAAREKAAAASPSPINYKSDFRIAAGKGTDQIFIGATRAAVEAALGQPDEFADASKGIFSVYAGYYYGKGINVDYDRQTKLVTNIIFFGDTAKAKGYEKYKLFPGATDKGIRWGMSPAEVMQAYGKPLREYTRYNPNIDKDYSEIDYANINFAFTENRLYFISVRASEASEKQTGDSKVNTNVSTTATPAAATVSETKISDSARLAIIKNLPSKGKAQIVRWLNSYPKDNTCIDLTGASGDLKTAVENGGIWGDYKMDDGQIGDIIYETANTCRQGDKLILLRIGTAIVTMAPKGIKRLK